MSAVHAAGMARKRSYHLQPRCWNEHRWFNLRGEFQTALLNWLCKVRKEVAVSLPNFLCNLISRSLSNLKLKYTTVFKHKRIHNCFTHSKVSRNIMAADAGNVPQLRAIITTHSMQYARSRWCTAYCTPLQQPRFWIHLMTVSMLNTELFQYLKRQDQRISKTCKSTFIFCSSWNLWEGAHFLHLACQGGGAPPFPPSVTPLPTVEKCRPPNHGLKQSQAFQDGIIS